MKILPILLLLFVFLPLNARAVIINEVRQSCTMETYANFVELKGSPSENLSNLHYLAIDANGILLDAKSLAGQAIASDCDYFVFADQNSSFDLPPYDLGNGLGYDATGMGGYRTTMLVEGFSGTIGTDLDSNDDGTIESPPWTNIIDSFSLIGGVNDTPGAYYSTTTIGPPPYPVSPRHVWRNHNTGNWVFSEDHGVDDSYKTADTPRAENAWVIAARATGIGSFLGGRFVVTITSSSTTEQLIVKVSETSGDPGGAITALAVLAPDATSLTPDIVSEDTYWVMTENFNPGSNISYTISIDATGETGIQNPDKVVIMKRSNSSSPWVPYSTTRVGSIYTAVITDGFSEFALGSDSAYNTLPAGLDYFMVD